MLEAPLQALSYFTPDVLFFMVVGLLVCQVLVVLPGLGGHFVLVMMLPFVFVLEPMQGIAMIVGASVTTGTGNTVTGVLFGVPGSPTGIATTFDGYPMAKMGQGARAVAAGLTASAAGGIFGAIVLALMLPIARPLVLALSAPDYFVLIVGALLALGYLGQQDTVKALVAGGLGFFVSFVGMEQSTGQVRYAFGSATLFDGVNVAAAFLGVFALAELMYLLRQGGSIAEERLDPGAGTVQGIMDVLRHNPRATSLSSLVGVVVGMVPGMGGGPAQFLAYTAVARSSKDPSRFGKGTVEGVIAADASVNATDAGQMVPTVGFGIPGSATAALLLAGFTAAGMEVGPQMLVRHVDILWMIVFILVFANIIAAAACILASGWLAKLTTIPVAFLAPPIFALSLFGAHWAMRDVMGVVIAVAFGLLGYLMRVHGYSRATFVIGFVLGAIMERYYVLAQELYGWAFLLRPITLGLTIFIVVAAVAPWLRRVLLRQEARRRERDSVPQSGRRR
jgi:putative tricarboxylic transport membrane protein